MAAGCPPQAPPTRRGCARLGRVGRPSTPSSPKNSRCALESGRTSSGAKRAQRRACASACSTRSRIAAATPVLALQRHVLLALGADDRDRVGVDIEAGVGAATRRWRRSGRPPCARASRAPWRRRRRSRRRSRRASGGPTTTATAAAPARPGCPASARSVSVSGAVASSRSFCAAGSRRRVVGHRGRHDDDVRAGPPSRMTAACISAALRTRTTLVDGRRLERGSDRRPA